MIAGGSHAEEDLGKLLTRPDGLPDSIFIAKLLEADNKLLGGRSFTKMEVRMSMHVLLRCVWLQRGWCSKAAIVFTC